MNKEFFARQLKRLPKLEGAKVVATPDGARSTGADISTRGRAPRTEVPGISSLDFSIGDEVLMYGGGDNDAPIILGGNPYIL